MTYDPCNITRNVVKMFSGTVVASDVRRRDWSIGSLGTACVCSFSRPLRDIYSRCHHSPQRRREPAPRRMRRATRGAASKCHCALCPVDMSKWNTCHQYERCCNLLKPNDIYMSYRSANLQTLHFKYLFNKYTY